jgi:cell division protease FtsH
MSEKLGPLTYGQKDEEIFLGRQITRHKNYSEETAISIDKEIKDIVDTQMKRAEKILKENIDILHRLALALLEREILDSTEIDTIIRGEQLPPMERSGNGRATSQATVSGTPSGLSGPDVSTTR